MKLWSIIRGPLYMLADRQKAVLSWITTDGSCYKTIGRVIKGKMSGSSNVEVIASPI